MAVPLIEQLGKSIERSWSAVDCDLAVFPRLCAEQLEGARLQERVSADDVIRAVFAGDLPQQSDPEARFGQPPVTLFRARGFFIDALFWVDGTTTIHDHTFSGAFQVLAGESIETNFAFAPERDLGGHLRLGGLTVNGSVLRRAGAVRAVPAGPVFIHSLFHLARPSVSLVVRTYKDPSPGAQFNYAPSGIAFDPFVSDPVVQRMIQVIEMLRKTDDRTFEERVGDLIAGADAHTAFSIVRSCTKVADLTMLDRLVGRIRDHDVGRRVKQWVSDRRRLEFLITRRTTVHDAELRFFLAVLLNCKRLADALALVAGFAPRNDPARQVAAWLRQLSATAIRLQVGTTPFEPNVLGLPSFGPGCEEGLADHLGRRGSPRSPEVGAFIDRLRALPALEPLFVDDEQQ